MSDLAFGQEIRSKQAEDAVSLLGAARQIEDAWTRLALAYGHLLPDVPERDALEEALSLLSEAIELAD